MKLIIRLGPTALQKAYGGVRWSTAKVFDGLISITSPLKSTGMSIYLYAPVNRTTVEVGLPKIEHHGKASRS
jgi:hypothetical protein